MFKDSLTSRRIVLAIIILLTMSLWVILAFRLPVLRLLPGWFWDFIDKPRGNLPAFLVIIVPASIALTVVRMNVKAKIGQLVILVLAGYCMQHGFALLEGRGIDGIRDRMVTTGHAEFAVVAVQQQSIWSTMSHYEELLHENKLGRYARSKPPGQLLLYMVTERLGRAIQSNESFASRLDWLTTFASLVWPLISYLTVFPLFALGRIIADEAVALRACALFLLVPSVTLVTLHTDQVFFPLFATSVLLLGVLAIRNQGSVHGVLAGVAFYISLFFTFALLFLGPLTVLCGALYGWQRRISRRIVVLFLTMLVGAVLADLSFRAILNYDILARFGDALAHHESWKIQVRVPVYWSVLVNLIEFAVWLGIPVALLCLVGVIDGAIHLNFKSITWAGIFAIALGVAVLSMDLVGRTQGEVARLWIFVVPLVCLVATAQFFRLFKSEKSNRVFLLIILLQIGTTYLLKVNQDFW
jgi:hypothetical protein